MQIIELHDWGVESYKCAVEDTDELLYFSKDDLSKLDLNWKLIKSFPFICSSMCRF